MNVICGYCKKEIEPTAYMAWDVKHGGQAFHYYCLQDLREEELCRDQESTLSPLIAPTVKLP